MGVQVCSSSETEANHHEATMVEWTDEERSLIQYIFNNLNYEEVGADALSRCLIVYPWCLRYFGNFGNLYSAKDIIANPMIAAHGVKIVHGLDRAMQNMDNIKDTYKELSTMHSEKLNVDPDNFRLFSDVLSIVIAGKLGVQTFTPEMQAAWQKFLNVVCSALGRQYHQKSMWPPRPGER